MTIDAEGFVPLLEFQSLQNFLQSVVKLRWQWGKITQSWISREVIESTWVKPLPSKVPLKWPKKYGHRKGEVSLSAFFFSVLFRASPVAYGGSQARGPIGTVAIGLCQSQGSNPRPHGCLSGLLTAEPQRELLVIVFIKNQMIEGIFICYLEFHSWNWC